jgi:hypothetical protein
MRQILIGLMIVLMLKFRPEGIFRERPGTDGAPGLAARLLRPFGTRAAAPPAGAIPAAEEQAAGDRGAG